jgi:hypothetical protein
VVGWWRVVEDRRASMSRSTDRGAVAFVVPVPGVVIWSAEATVTALGGVRVDPPRRAPLREPGPDVSVDTTPRLAVAGEVVDILVLVTNPTSAPIEGAVVGLVLPAGLSPIEVTTPTGAQACVRLEGDAVVVEVPVDLPGSCARGLDVAVGAPAASGRYAISGYLRLPGGPHWLLDTCSIDVL